MTATIRENTSPHRASTSPRQSGDVLDVSEYWRRYAATQDKVKSERINRKECILSSLRTVHHGNFYLLLAQWIALFVMHDSIVIGSDNATICLNTDNDPEPGL